MVLVGIGSSVPWRIRARAVLGLVLLALLALAAAGAVRSGSATRPAPGSLGDSRLAAALGTNWYASAPYYLTLDSQAPDLPQVMAATGQKAFVLSFILDGGGCTPTWDGTNPLSDASVAGVVNAVRAAGGDVSASAGGYNGNKLGAGCGSAAATADAYQRVINAYGLHAIDFDLEEPEIENSGAIANELGAAQILQRNNPGLFVSVTMPSSTSGANYFGQLLLNQARSLGFTPDDYSIMPFDGGFSGGASQVSALQAFNSQLMSTFGWSSTTAYQHEGFSGMNGRSDTGEIFTTGDFQTVLSFAQSSGMTRYTFWSENRDRQCSPPDNNGRTSSDCSSVPQNAGDFTAYTVRFAGGTPGQPPPPPSPPPPGSCVAPWSATQIYVGGNQASYNGHNWTAKWWTQGDVPGGQAGVWADNGPCSGGHTGQITGNGGKCVDVAGANPADGTHVQLWTCNGTNAQQWTWNTGDRTVRALGKCMDVTWGGTASGTKVQLWTCNGTGAQVWQPRSDGSLLNPQSGRCLDDPGANPADGIQLQIWDCNGTVAQVWHMP